MSNVVSLNEKDRERVETELAQCQARVLQTLVPTILALGVIGIAESKSIKDISLGAMFAVLFCSSLYVMSLSHKIFRNAAFLKVFASTEESGNGISWEGALDRYREKGWLPPVVHSETTTAAVIYVALSATFLLIFYKVNPVVTIVDTVILLLISFGIFVMYIRRDKTLIKWRIIKAEIEKSARHRHQGPENS